LIGKAPPLSKKRKGDTICAHINFQRGWLAIGVRRSLHSGDHKEKLKKLQGRHQWELAERVSPDSYIEDGAGALSSPKEEECSLPYSQTPS